MATVPFAPSTNCLLAALSPEEQQRLLPEFETVALSSKQYLHSPGCAMDHAYFPAGGFCSIVNVLKDGRMVEVATIGREGALGTFPATSGARASSLVIVQAPTDTCYRMPIDRLRYELEKRGSLYALLTAYHNALTGAIMQGTVCNAVHGVEQRLARWLLMAHDRVGDDQFPLTQEFVAMMLGVSRPTVTVVAGGLQALGMITYHRGVLTIHNREQLENAACECYRVMTDELRAVSEPPCEWDFSPGLE